MTLVYRESQDIAVIQVRAHEFLFFGLGEEMTLDASRTSTVPELVSLQLPHLAQHTKVAGAFCSICKVTFAAVFLIKKSGIHDLLQCRDLEITCQNSL